MATQVPARAREDLFRLHYSRGKPAVEILGSAQHRALREKLDAIQFIPSVWSPAAQKGVVDLAKRWER